MTLFRFLLPLFLIFVLSACKQRLPNPHLSDPIYRHISSQLSEAEKEKGELVEYEELYRKEYENAQPQTGEEPAKRRLWFKTKKELAKLEQDIQLYKLQLDRRKAEVELEYDSAFRSGSEWPPESLVTEFEIYRKHRESSRNWEDKRLPSSQIE